MWLLTLLALVSLRVYPLVIPAGGAAQVTCRIEPHKDNRKLTVEIENYTSSTRDLEGADAPVTWVFNFKEIPCGTTRVSCLVERLGGKKVGTSQQVTMTGCN